MGRFIIKPEPDKDFYVVWSSIVDDMIYCGTTAEIEKYLLEEARRRAEEKVAAFLYQGVSLADELGTSSGFYTGAWLSPRLDVARGGQRVLPRERLMEYAQLRRSGRNDEAEALLESRSPEDG